MSSSASDPAAATQLLTQLEERVEWLETKLAYQDRLLETLNGMVTTQQDTLDRLSAKLRELLSEHRLVERSDDEKPPHY